MKTKGATRVTEDEKRAYDKKRDDGWSVARAAEAIGRSKKWAEGYEQAKRLAKVAQQSKEPPPPLTYDQLDGGVKDTLKDFLLFRRVFLCRDEVPWAENAALKIVGMLSEGRDLGERLYAVINTPPGAGKSTLFTMDIPAWLICGGGAEDPVVGRALRIMLGHVTKTIAEQYVMRLRRFFAMKEPFRYYDRNDKTERVAELAPSFAFGRFKPVVAEGDEATWTKEQFIVAQVGRELYEKEPTVQAASYGSEFIGARVDLGIWDDPDDPAKTITIEGATQKNEWVENVAEQRVEPGGLFAIVQQRLSPLDLSGSRLKATEVNDDGLETPLYRHIKYPAHFDDLCDDDHRQWDGKDDGCLLDAKRLSYRHLQRQMTKHNYLTLFQQEESNPLDTLIQPAWIDGGTDLSGYTAIGCKDTNRGFWEWPAGPGLIDYMVVDPSVSNFWAFEWWCVNPHTRVRYLIWGDRRRMNPGTELGFLDWDENLRTHVGLVEDLQVMSGKKGHPILFWVIEQNAAHSYLTRVNAYKTWRMKWPLVTVIPHQTQKNKIDATYGVQALMPMAYKQGLKRLPYKHGDMAARNYLDRYKIPELTKWPFHPTDDTVMADWFGEYNLERICREGPGKLVRPPETPPPGMPPYLRRRTYGY